MDIESEMVKIIFVIIFLVVMAGAVFFLLNGKGGDILASVRNVLRFGR